MLDGEIIPSWALRMEDDDDAPWYEAGEVWCIALRRGREMTHRAYTGHHPEQVYGAGTQFHTFLREDEYGIPMGWSR